MLIDIVLLCECVCVYLCLLYLYHNVILLLLLLLLLFHLKEHLFLVRVCVYAYHLIVSGIKYIIIIIRKDISG